MPAQLDQARVFQIAVQAVWTCKVCHRVNVRKAALVYWSGTDMIGLICGGHDLDEIESAIRTTLEPLH